MPDSTLAVPAAANDTSPKVRSALLALADVDHRYAVECEYLTGWQGPTPAMERLVSELEAHYRKRRAVLVERLIVCLR